MSMRAIRKVSIMNAMTLGVFAMLLSLAALCAAVMPSPAEAQDTIASLGVCMAESDCLQGEPTLPDAKNCTAKFCFAVPRPPNCQGNTSICYVQSPKQTLSVPIGNATITDLAGYIQAVYDFAVAAAAVLAATMMMIGGFQYLMAGGDAGRVSAAKDRITGALIGLVLASAAYLILNTINPNLANLQLPMIPVVKQQRFVGCESVAKCKPCGVEFDIKVKKDSSGKTITPAEGDCRSVDLLAKGAGDVTCVGKGCDSASTAGKCDGLSQRCVAGGAGKTDRCGLVPPDQAASASWICDACTPNGESCDEKGASEKCCGGFCSNGVCTGGEIGVACHDSGECKSGTCAGSNLVVDGICSTGSVGSPCAGHEDCTGGNKCAGHVISGIDGFCLPGDEYSLCFFDSDCQAGFECEGSVASNVLTAGGGVCVPRGTSVETCAVTSCKTAAYCAKGLCTDGGPGVPCTTDNDCKRTVQAVDGGASDAHCVNMKASTSVCTSGAVGSICGEDEDCFDGTNHNFCWTKGADLSVCVSGTLGSRCDDKCASGLICQDGTCITK